MKAKIIIQTTLCLLVITFKSLGVYMDGFPQTITQPNGLVVNCYISGDEYYNWLHDKDNFTIVQNPETGFYCYALYQDGKLIASKYIVGEDDPVKAGLLPGAQLSEEQIREITSASAINDPEEPGNNLKSGKMDSPRTLNNIVIYIRFSDQKEFGIKQPRYSYYFNATREGANSMINYFWEASYQKLRIISSFYPVNNGIQILSYQDSHTRNYYCPLTMENDSGYPMTDNGKTMRARKFELIENAVKYIQKQVPPELDLDTDKDGKVDNVCFIIRGGVMVPNGPNTTCLWPHAYKLIDKKDVFIGSKMLWRYNIQLENFLDYKRNGVLCHEMFHSLGGGDLYRYQCRPVGPWDIMAETMNPPQSMCADYKYRYGRWIDSIPEITRSGNYTLHPITSPENNCYRIPSSNTGEYFMLEFRQKKGTFESSIPGTGLIIYKIDKSECCMNDDVHDRTLNWIYIYRPGGSNSSDGKIKDAWFDASAGRSAFHNNSDPACYLSDNSPGNIFIKNIEVCDNTVSFDVRFCNQVDDVLLTETNPLPPIINAMNRIETSGPVMIKDSDNIQFEAGQEIILNPGFEIQPGGEFETNINCCGQQ